MVQIYQYFGTLTNFVIGGKVLLRIFESWNLKSLLLDWRKLNILFNFFEPFSRSWNLLLGTIKYASVFLKINRSSFVPHFNHSFCFNSLSHFWKKILFLLLKLLECLALDFNTCSRVAILVVGSFKLKPSLSFSFFSSLIKHFSPINSLKRFLLFNIISTRNKITDRNRYIIWIRKTFEAQASLETNISFEAKHHKQIQYWHNYYHYDS